jgi:hypothetical protein
MQSFKKFSYLLLLVIFVIAVGWIVEHNYSLIFSRSVSGEVVDVQHVNSNVAVLNQGTEQNDALFSFAVAIRDEKGVIFTASSNDRRWAVVKPGFCADVVFYPFPPWDLGNSGTYSNARLLHMRDCPPGLGKAAPVSAVAPVASATPSP